MKNILGAVAFLVVANMEMAEGSTSPLRARIIALNYKLLNQIQKTEKDKNIFISSLSIHEAISMAYVGATGATQLELANLLGISQEDSLEALGDEWVSLRGSLQNADKKVTLEIANSMWGNSALRVKFLPRFVSLNQRAHDALFEAGVGRWR